MDVVVAVQHQFHAAPLQHRAERLRNPSGASCANSSAGDDAPAAPGRRPRSTIAPACDRARRAARGRACRSPSAAASAPRRIRRSAPAVRGGARTETPRCRPRRRRRADNRLEHVREMMPCGADIGVVIAGNDGDLLAAGRRFRARPAPAVNSASSARLTRSPVTAMWSGRCACMSATSASSTSRRWYLWRLRVQLR